MPASAIPYDSIVTVQTPQPGVDYYTWLPGRAGEVERITRITDLAYYLGDGRRLARGTRRKWAVLNPEPEPGKVYIAINNPMMGQWDSVPRVGATIHWLPTMPTDARYSRGRRIARLVGQDSNVYVDSFVEARVTDVLSTNVFAVGSLSGTDDTQVRVISSRVHPEFVGTVRGAWSTYLEDTRATGVVLSATRHLDRGRIAPDPGPGPYRVVTPTEVPSYNIHRLGTTSSSPGTTVRIITSADPDMVGQIGESNGFYSRDTTARGVIVAAVRNVDIRRIAPDPGPGPYQVIEARVPSPFIRRQEVVYVGTDPNVPWVAPVYATVVDVYNTEERNVEVQRESGGGSNLNVYASVRHEDLVLTSEYVDTRPPCPRCETPRCRCLPCDVCGEQDSRSNLANNTSTGEWLHAGCSTQCRHCGDRYRESSIVMVPYVGESGEEMRSYCTNCTRMCGGCRAVRVAPGTRNCPPCRRRAEDGVRSYGHTVPDMWLGGPLPKNDKGHQIGFYIGFELEVSSRDFTDVTPLREWTEANLGNRRALDPKRDGSVSGFEIATQPMTPEFFESIDWDGFMANLDQHHPTWDTTPSREPVEHGLHVHIGRVAFERDDIAMAMFTYLIGQGDNLARIGRRDPTNYCNKVDKPASVGLVNRTSRTGKGRKQTQRIQSQGVYLGRDAINLSNAETIEIRAFRSTRNAEHLRAAVRVVYLAARYIAHLRGEASQMGQHGYALTRFVSPKALHWDSFMAWVQEVMPEAVDGLTIPKMDTESEVIHEFEEDEDEDDRCSCYECRVDRGEVEDEVEDEDEDDLVEITPIPAPLPRISINRVSTPTTLVSQFNTAAAEFTRWA